MVNVWFKRKENALQDLTTSFRQTTVVAPKGTAQGKTGAGKASGARGGARTKKQTRLIQRTKDRWKKTRTTVGGAGRAYISKEKSQIDVITKHATAAAKKGARRRKAAARKDAPTPAKAKTNI